MHKTPELLQNCQKQLPQIKPKVTRCCDQENRVCVCVEGWGAASLPTYMLEIQCMGLCSIQPLPLIINNVCQITVRSRLALQCRVWSCERNNILNSILFNGDMDYKMITWLVWLPSMKSMSWRKVITFCVITFLVKYYYYLVCITFASKSYDTTRERVINFPRRFYFAAKVITYLVKITLCVNYHICRGLTYGCPYMHGFERGRVRRDWLFYNIVEINKISFIQTINMIIIK